MEQFDKRLKETAEKEEMIVPDGFDGRLRETLDGLPSRKGRKRLGAVKSVLIAAAACALLAGTAGAVSLISRQASIRYLDREQFTEGYNAYLEENGHSSSQYSDNGYTGRDFTLKDAQWWESWWQGPGELAEETAGTEQDGWTAKRVFKSSLSSTSYGLWRGQTYEEARYQADRVSDYGSLLDCWDLSWLEEHYTANPYGVFARTVTCRDELRFFAVGGEYRNGETWFNLSYCWDSTRIAEDEYRVAGNKEYAELYTTPDGVEAAIEMDTSDTGNSVFWVTLSGGHNSFEMFGTRMEIDDLHDILDSLELSKLLEADPAG